MKNLFIPPPPTLVYFSSSNIPSDKRVRLPISGKYNTFFTTTLVVLPFFIPSNSISPIKLVVRLSPLLLNPYTLLLLHSLNSPTKLLGSPQRCQEQPPSTILPESFAFGGVTLLEVVLPKYTNTATSLPSVLTTLPTVWLDGVNPNPTASILLLPTSEHTLPHILVPKPTPIPALLTTQPNINIIVYIIHLTILTLCTISLPTELHLFCLYVTVVCTCIALLRCVVIVVLSVLFFFFSFVSFSSLAVFSFLSFSINLSLMDCDCLSLRMYCLCCFCLFFFSNRSSSLTGRVVLVS